MPTITEEEEDRLRLEVDTLQKVVQRFADMQDPNPAVVRNIAKAREALSIIKKRRKALVRDEVEEACFYVVNQATLAKIREPAIIISRFGKNEWEAYIEKFESAEFIGVGIGISPLEAVRDLLAATKSYVARCKRGAERHRSV